MAAASDPNPSDSFMQQFFQESCYPEELRESIISSSLPREEGWVSNHIYNYKGFWLEPFFLHGALRSQQHFQAQHSDVILSTLPKCGTTWLKALVFALITRKQFPVSQQTHPLLTTSPQDLFRNMEFSYARESSPDFPMNNGFRVLSTHLPLSLLPESVGESKCKLIYLCRNQKDTVVSFWHFMNELRGEVRGLGAMAFPEAFEKYCRGESLYGPFWDHLLGYWKESLENPGKVLFLKYEEMKKEADVQLRRMAAFLECPFSEEEEEGGVVGGILRLCSFESLSNLEINKTGKGLFFGRPNNVYFRKGKVGDWRNHLTDEMTGKLDQIAEQKFKGTGLKFP